MNIVIALLLLSSVAMFYFVMTYLIYLTYKEKMYPVTGLAISLALLVAAAILIVVKKVMML